MAERRYWLETYGCQMNKAESEALELDLMQHGWQPAQEPSQAQLVLLNTCSVRKTAEDRIWGRIGNFKHEKQNRPFLLGLVGCMSQRLQNEIQKEVPEVDIVVGTFQKKNFIEIVEHALAEKRGIVAARETPYEFSKSHSSGGFKAYVPIMHGCNNYCSYCIVPYVRGPEVSRPPEDIYNEIESLVKNGVKEITLLGQNVNSYNYAGKQGRVFFMDLLKTIAADYCGNAWVRFMTSHPKDMTRQLIDIIAEHHQLCRHIHLPLQHASNRILEKMNRKYTFEQYRELVLYMKNTVREVTVTTDILIGFPGETGEDFQRTLDAMRELRFDDAFMYYYNPREGTAAFDYPDTLSGEEKKKRLAEVIALQREIKQEKLQRKIGSGAISLVEEVSRRDDTRLLARTEHNDMVVFPGAAALIGTFQKLHITELKGATLVAEIKN
ncbi:MAG: tRNA (N6-isopentenyl adenosine(37)-C2)-methylthiotransferase MiaB [Spirochaetales bacterium]|nr:tRNA (N6-isopentenyl adenosine(37)-C2)-methylthiotransferase MiaB [Spirochaetales bacterium]